MPKYSSLLSEAWGFTQLKKMQFKYTWTIENFASCWEGMGNEIWSPNFATGTNIKNVWSLILAPKSADSYQHVSIGLHLDQINRNGVNAKFVISITNAKRKKEKSTEINVVHHFNPGTTKNFEKFISRDFLLSEANGLLSDENLTIVAEITIFAEPTNTSEQDNDVQHKASVGQLLEDFKKLFESQKFTDVTLSVCGNDLRAHKAVLAARSTVFAAMFGHDMEESKANRVEINDVEQDVFMEILRFIYTGNTINLNETAGEVLAAAEKYDLEELKIICEQAMFKNLSTENATNTLIYAELYCASQLKAQAIDFINTHLKLVMETDGFKKMMSSHPNLFEEVLRAVATRRISQE